jgi:hypothetical protein
MEAQDAFGLHLVETDAEGFLPAREEDIPSLGVEPRIIARRYT